MSKAIRGQGRGERPRRSPLWLMLLLVTVAVAVTTAHVWRKVERADVAQRISAARARADVLQEERSRLRADVVMRTKPGIIKHIAETRLKMFPASDTRGADHSNVRDDADVSRG